VRQSPRVIAALALLVLLLGFAGAVSGCGSDNKKTSGSEGEFINVGDAVYQVQLTRLLNPEQRPDNDYLRGQPPLSANEAYLGSFLTIDNEGKTPYSPPRDMKVVDTQGNEYLPLGTPQSSFGLDFGKPIPPDQSAPPPNSPADGGPEGGAMVLFRIKTPSATDNLPLYLEVPAPGGKTSRIRLDV
jgi:hypothetical protein